jgi:hypothetical protein
MMGRADTPLRRILNYAQDEFCRHLPLLYVLTVVGTNNRRELVTRGLFIGDDHDCYRQAGTVEGRGHDPHMQARQTHEQIDHPFTGIEHMHNIPWKLSDTPPKIRGPAPHVGQHNDYVFGELLGLSAEAQRQLAEDGCL